MKKNVFYSIALVALLFSSCATPNVSYFNDMNHGQIEDSPMTKFQLLSRVRMLFSLICSTYPLFLTELVTLKHHL